VAADLKEPVAVRGVIAVEAPGPAHTVAPRASPRLEQRDVLWLTVELRLFGAVDHQLLPELEAGAVVFWDVGGLGEALAVTACRRVQALLPTVADPEDPGLVRSMPASTMVHSSR